MRKISMYITIVVLLVSVVFVTGAMADDVAPLIKPLFFDRSVLSGLYVGDYAEEVATINIPEMGYGMIQVTSSYSYLRLQPGETSSFTVTVTNRDDEAVNIDPVMVLPSYTENYLEKEWVTVIPSNIVMQSDEKKEFTVEVAIPDDADLGYYNANIIFDRSVISEGAESSVADEKISAYYLWEHN
ncbi:hypothetical protein [Methanolobus sp.]|uniref:COG1470 family protein n=1 Tax=Methanolobus sp. TaxID=1874737 RepID=UPI0025F42668|nr:hypothetical protein [Methanolobus sp.]